jgi:hypothetical protein
MSGTNASIPLQFQPVQNAGPSIGAAAQTANQLMALQAAQRQVQQQNALRGILGAPGAVDATGNPTPDAMQQIMAVDPNTGLKLKQNALVAQDQQLRQSVLKTQAFGQKLDMLNDTYGPVMERYKEAIKQGKTPEQAMSLAQTDLDAANQQLSSGGLFSADEQKTHPTKFDPVQMQRFFDGSQIVRDHIKSETAAHHEQFDEDYKAADLALKERQGDKTLEAGWTVVTDPNAKDADGKLAPVQYRYNARTGQATTLAGEPYTPGGQAKIGSGGPADDKPMSDDAIAYAGTMYRDKGTLPSFGNSKYAVADRKRIIDWAADRKNKNVDAAGTDVVTQAGVKADTASLAQTTRYRNQVESFEETAQQSANLIRSLAPKGLGPTGVPVIDSWMQAGRRAVGNADVVKFGNAIDTFTSEYAKIMSGATGASGSTDSARSKAEGLINKAQNADQLYGALDVMQQEMNIRRKSLTDQESQIRKELGLAGGKNDPDAPADDAGKADKSGTPTPGATPPPKQGQGALYTGDQPPPAHPDAKRAPDGNWYVKQGNKWAPVLSVEPAPQAKTTPASQATATPPPAPQAGAPPPNSYAVPQNRANDPDGTTYNGGAFIKKGGFIQAAPSGGSGGGDPLAQARTAIAAGAPRDAVIARLKQNGIDPGGL